MNPITLTDTEDRARMKRCFTIEVDAVDLMSVLNQMEVTERQAVTEVAAMGLSGMLLALSKIAAQAEKINGPKLWENPITGARP